MLRHSTLLYAIGAIPLLFMRSSVGQKSRIIYPILARDVDKRPLPQVSMATLSPRMRAALHAMESEAKQDAGTSRAPRFTIQQIPVAPHDHKLFLVLFLGPAVCSGTGVNCWLAVFDEMQNTVDPVVKGQLADVLVIRRPHLQMPDIGAREQLGHFGNSMTVYRFSDNEWTPYACKESSISDADDPHPNFIADSNCSP